MKLSEYLEAKSMTPTAFATVCGVSRSTINRILHLKRRPGLKVLAAIQVATKGKVTARDFADDEYRRG
jgi:transcriptional regulator with XRE-family HTH domain